MDQAPKSPPDHSFFTDLHFNYSVILAELPFAFVIYKIVTDQNGNFIDCKHQMINPAYEKLCGLSTNELINHDFFNLFPKAELYWREAFEKVYITQKNVTFSNYSIIFNRFLDVKIFSPEKNILAASFISNSKERKAKDKASERQKKIKSMFRAAPIGFGTIVSRIIIEANDTLLKLTGYNSQELIGQATSILYANPLDFEEIGTAYQEGNEWVNLRKETLWKKKDGSMIDVLLCLAPLNPGKPTEGIVFTALDISDRKENIRLLIENEKRLIESNNKFFAANESLNNANQSLIQLNTELAIAKLKAEEGERLKTAFLQNMSHEIRTPLNAIMGFSQLIEKQFNNPDLLRKYVGIVLQQGDYLLKIVDEILEISLLETGQVNVNNSKCEVNQLLDEILNYSQKMLHNQKKQHITLNLVKTSGRKRFIYTDITKLRQVFNNLIHNAIKYSNDGNIDFGVHAIRKDSIIFFVSDNGIGIPKDKFEYIFDRFKQIEPTDKVREGLGLGLSISRNLTQLLGGNIWLKSEPGEGSTFYFSVSQNLVSNKTNLFFNQSLS